MAYEIPALDDLTKRVDALEGRPDPATVLADVIARVAKLEGGSVAVPDPQTPPAEPEQPPATASKAIWEILPDMPMATLPGEVRVKPGTKEIFIPVEMRGGFIRQSCYAYISGLSNATGGGINVGNAAAQAANFTFGGETYTWSPGDDPIHWIRLICKAGYSVGKFLNVAIRVKGLGDRPTSQKGGAVRVVWADDAADQVVTPQFHRPMRTLDLSNAKRSNDFKPAAELWDDSGFKGSDQVWLSRLAHGYNQWGNGETGLYMNDQKFPGKGRPIEYDGAEKALRLPTMAFPMESRPELDGVLYRHQACMLSGQTMDAVCGVDGVWRMVAKIPVRRYSWPAFWLVGRGRYGARGSYISWPPEWDVLEKFNGIYGADTLTTTTCGQHFGKVGKQKASGTGGGSMGTEVETDQWFGVSKPLDEEYHSWACHVRYDADPLKSEITFFFDDKEVCCQVLFARNEDLTKREVMFPMFNVAVKAPSGYTPEQYNTDDGRGHTGDMLVRDVAYYPTGAVVR